MIGGETGVSFIYFDVRSTGRALAAFTSALDGGEWLGGKGVVLDVVLIFFFHFLNQGNRHLIDFFN